MYRESEIIELKREYTEDIRKEIIAFANTNGGTIYVGVDDNGDIVGIDDCDALMLKIGNLVRDFSLSQILLHLFITIIW